MASEVSVSQAQQVHGDPDPVMELGAALHATSLTDQATIRVDITTGPNKANSSDSTGNSDDNGSTSTASAADDVSPSEAAPHWMNYDGFVPDPKAQFLPEFTRLANHEGWKKRKTRTQRAKFLKAEFETHFGDENVSLSNWQKLCRTCKIEPVPDSINQCRKALAKVLVNIVNLVNSHRTGEGVIVFRTKLEFIRYTWPNRTYPLDRAKSGTLMNSLLRPVSCEEYRKQADREFKKHHATRRG